MSKTEFSLFDDFMTKDELLKSYGIRNFEELISSIPRHELEPDPDYDSKSIKLYLQKLVENLSHDIYTDMKDSFRGDRDEIRASFLDGITDENHRPITRITDSDRAYDVAFRLKSHFEKNLSKYLTLDEIKKLMKV